jgi:hypothetical protein
MRLIDAFLLTIVLYLITHILFGWNKIEARAREHHKEHQILEHKTNQEVKP